MPRSTTAIVKECWQCRQDTAVGSSHTTESASHTPGGCPRAIGSGDGMATPIVFLVDGEGSELEALTEALGRRFGIDYQIRGDRSPTGALVTLARLAAGLAAPGRAQPRGAARGRRLLRRGGSRGP